MGFGSIVSRIFTPVKLKKRVFDPEKIEIVDLHLPNYIENFDDSTVTSMVKEEVITFKSLNYKNKIDDELKTKEYHSFQIGIILKFFKLEYDLLLKDSKDIFPAFIINTPKEKIKYKAYYIINEYGNTVSKGLTGKQLIADVRWTPLDVAYLLYYLSIYK